MSLDRKAFILLAVIFSVMELVPFYILWIVGKHPECFLPNPFAIPAFIIMSMVFIIIIPMVIKMMKTEFWDGR